MELDTSNLLLQIASDLHLEFEGALEKMPEIPVKAPCLALLGDIGFPQSERYQEFVLAQADRFKLVFLVAGNHEFYNISYVRGIEEMQKLAAQRDNIIFLNQTSYLHGNIRIIGTTLWSDIPPKAVDAIGYMVNDYRRIVVRDGDKENGKEPEWFTVPIQNQMHNDQVEWIKSQIAEAKKAGEKVVVLTHHAPSDIDCLCTAEQEFPLRHMNYSKLESLFGPPVELWGFGHTHWNTDQIINGTRYVSNQLGYVTRGEDTNHYNPDLVIDLNNPPEHLKRTTIKSSSCCVS